MEDIIEEAKQIVSTGRRELILIAQDTSKYGKDIYGKPKLAELLTELCKIKDLKWERFLYTYPEDITDELIKVVKENDKICKYFDIPIQHISNSVLKRMNRKTSKQNIEDVITRIALVNPNIAIKLINTGKTVIQTNGNGDIKSVIYSIYGKDVATGVMPVEYAYDDIQVSGVIGKPEIARSNRSNQLFFVNKRYVKESKTNSWGFWLF